MTDHDKLIIVLIGTDNSTQRANVALGDVVRMLYELGAHYRQHLELKTAS